MRELRPSWAHAVVGVLVFASLPAFRARSDAVCAVGSACRRYDVPVSLFGMLDRPSTTLEPAVLPLAAGLAAAAGAAFLLVAGGRLFAERWGASARRVLAPDRARVLLAAYGLLPLPSVVMHWVNYQVGGPHALGALGRAAYAAASILWALALPFALLEGLAARAVVVLATGWSRVAHAPWLDPLWGTDFRPEYLSGFGLGLVLVTMAATSWALACAAAEAWRAWRARA